MRMAGQTVLKFQILTSCCSRLCKSMLFVAMFPPAFSVAEFMVTRLGHATEMPEPPRAEPIRAECRRYPPGHGTPSPRCSSWDIVDLHAKTAIQKIAEGVEPDLVPREERGADSLNSE